MARIRSIFPEMATDEAYMAMSAYTKAAWPLLWTQCDDHGVFEWKPLVLKARILPADMIDFETILAELVSLDRVRKVEIDGREYGLVRNFGKFQRPRKPNYLFPVPDEYRSYLALSGPSTEPGPLEDDPVPQKSGSAPQMEDGGGSRKRENKKPEPVGSGGEPPSTSQFIFAKGRELLALAERPPKDPGALIGKWLRESGDDAVLLALKSCEAKRTPDPVSYITAALRKRGPPGAPNDDAIYRGVL